MSKHVYKKEQLDLMSDFELHEAVAEKLGLDFYIYNESVRLSSGTHLIDDSYFEPLKNYNDCMPIAQRLKTYMIKSTSCGQHRVLFGGSAVTQPTIQRAIVYCFLMMEV